MELPEKTLRNQPHHPTWHCPLPTPSWQPPRTVPTQLRRARGLRLEGRTGRTERSGFMGQRRAGKNVRCSTGPIAADRLPPLQHTRSRGGGCSAITPHLAPRRPSLPPPQHTHSGDRCSPVRAVPRQRLRPTAAVPCARDMMCRRRVGAGVVRTRQVAQTGGVGCPVWSDRQLPVS